MEKHNDRLREACSELREIIANNKTHLDDLQEQIDESQKSGSAIDRLQIENASPIAALETRKHSFAYLQGGLKSSDCKPDCKLDKLTLMVALQHTNLYSVFAKLF
jgi:hypothetical protein